MLVFRDVPVRFFLSVPVSYFFGPTTGGQIPDSCFCHTHQFSVVVSTCERRRDVINSCTMSVHARDESYQISRPFGKKFDFVKIKSQKLKCENSKIKLCTMYIYSPNE